MSEWNFFLILTEKEKKKDLKIELAILGQKSKVNERGKKRGGGNSPATSDGLEPTSKASSTGLSTGRKAVKDTESISEVKMNVKLVSFV
jgi:hypothetical protein